MKNNLGKFFLLLTLLLHVELLASTYEWSAKASKTQAYVNEAVYLSYTCTFSDRAELYSIEFNLVGDYKDYSIKLLTEDIKVQDGKKINSYEFIAFMKDNGDKEVRDVEFNFEALMKKTNEDSIKNTVLGRDNAFYEEFTKTKVKQKVLHVKVKKIPSELVGDFTIDVKQDTKQVKAFQPYHMEVLIKGHGDLDMIKPLEYKIDGVKIFASKIIRDIELTKDGYKGSIVQKFAFVSDKPFDIEKKSIKYFNLSTKSLQTLDVEPLHVDVKKGYEKSKLVDKIDGKKFKVNYDYIYYFLAFIFGYLVSKIKFKKRGTNTDKNKSLISKIDSCKNMDDVVITLLISDEDKYKTLIKRVENKEINSIKEVKIELNKA